MLPLKSREADFFPFWAVADNIRLPIYGGIQTMEREQQTEFRLLEEDVHRQLREGTSREAAPGIRLFHYVELPSFTDRTCFEVFRHGGTAVAVTQGQEETPATSARCEYIAVRTRWCFTQDLRAFESPVARVKHPRPFKPTLKIDKVSVARETIGEFLTRLAGITIPVMVLGQPIGCDGASYEFQVGDFWLGSRFSWWVKMPREWQPLESAVTDLLAYIQSCFSDDT